MTTIIMTEVKDSLYGNYTKFTVKGDGKIIAEVDRKEGKYVVFGNNQQIGVRSGKWSAIKFAQDYILGFIPDAEFKWNVMTEKIKHY